MCAISAYPLQLSKEMESVGMGQPPNEQSLRGVRRAASTKEGAAVRRYLHMHVLTMHDSIPQRSSSLLFRCQVDFQDRFVVLCV